MSWYCKDCGKHHLAFRTGCGTYRRCIECDEEALEFTHGLCQKCYARWRRARNRPKHLICIQCCKEFTSARRDAKCCSARCRQAQHRARGPKAALSQYQVRRAPVSAAPL